MHVYNSLDEFRRLPGAVVTMGIFDGVHVGHHRLLQYLCQYAQRIGSETVLVTYWPHPRTIIAQARTVPLYLLNTLEEKQRLLAQQGIDHLLIIPFTRALAMRSAQDFVRRVLIETIGVQHIVVGPNHHFGRRRIGDLLLLQRMGQRYGFTAEAAPLAAIDEVTVSATHIRQCLLEGDVAQANTYLGYPYEIACTVTDCSATRTAMVHLALLVTTSHKLIPPAGNYTIKLCDGDRTYAGRLHIWYHTGGVHMEAQVRDLPLLPVSHSVRIQFV